MVGITRYIEHATKMADEHNIEVLEGAIEDAFLDGTLIIKNRKIYNTITKRSYSGTGSWFREDMVDYIGSRVVPMVKEAKNPNNLDSGDKQYKLLFQVNGQEVDIYYYDVDKNKVVMTTVND